MRPKLLVCGATGFIGRNMVEHFAASGHYDVHAVRFTRPEYPCSGVTWHQADLRSPDQVHALLQGMDIIVQAAATTSGAKDIVARPYLHVTDNAVMNSYLFRTAFERKVQHVIFFSCSVMYPSSDSPLEEADFDASQPLHPRYFGVGHTKLYLEKMCEFFASLGSTKFTAVRHSNIYGAHDKFDLERSHVCGATITKVMTAQDAVTVWGTGEEERDLLHVSDLTNFVEVVLQKQTQPYQLYNCGAGRAIAVRDLVQQVIAASKKSLVVKYDKSQPTIKTSLCLDCSLAKTELGWEPRLTLTDGLQRTIAWWRQHIGQEAADVKEIAP